MYNMYGYIFCVYTAFPSNHLKVTDSITVHLDISQQASPKSGHILHITVAHPQCHYCTPENQHCPNNI